VRVYGVLADRNGPRYLVYAPSPQPTVSSTPAVDEAGGNATRRLADCVLYAIGGSGALAAIWFGFVVPSAPAPPATAALTSSPAIAVSSVRWPR
jgi:hypothetical protein